MNLGRLIAVFGIALLVITSTGGVTAQGEGPAGPAAPQGLGAGFTYQGRLQTGGGGVSGNCDFQFGLWGALTGTTQLGVTQTVSALPVSEGLFTAQVNNGNEFGSGAFDGSNRYLAIAVRCPAGGGSYADLDPRQELLATPYAQFALAAPWDGLTGVPAGFADGVDDVGGGSFWSLTGNAGTTTGNFLGTTDTMTLTLMVSGTTALRLIPTGGAPNVVGGAASNSAAAGVSGAAVGGGAANTAGDSYTTVGGGFENSASVEGAAIGGGQENTANGADAAVAGGFQNTAGFRGAVGGGSSNSASASWTTVSGGRENSASAEAATVGGGYTNAASGDYAVVGGGYSNTASGSYAALGGGNLNLASGGSATISGGYSNTASGGYTALSGGYNNNVSALYATAGGGRDNRVTAIFGTVGGGNSQFLTGYAATIGGGENNSATANYATVGGGDRNTASGADATVAGGVLGEASGQSATVSGGNGNTATNNYATVGGGDRNAASGLYATIGGGILSTASGAYATVGGGYTNDASVNWATVSGGRSSTASGLYATVGGGFGNAASGASSTVPGGEANTAAGEYSFAAGLNARALHDGAFVWADGSGAIISSTVANQFLVRASGGVTMYTDSGATVGAALLPGSSSWTVVSDRNAKSNFAPVDGVAILNALAGIPVETWNYNTQAAAIRHMGPMAQDFHAAFGLGETDLGISTVDADGVALAAIQGLYTVVQAKEALLAEQQAALVEQSASIAALNERVAALEAGETAHPAQSLRASVSTAGGGYGQLLLGLLLGAGIAGGAFVAGRKSPPRSR